jgi:arylsulfatase A-like enzyme
VPDYLWSFTPFADEGERHRLRPWKAKYAAGIRDLDRRLGDLLDRLRRAGRLEDAWLVLTSDHGEEFLEHNHWDHGESLCDHQLHVPLWVRGPKAEGAGRSVDEVISLMDLMPTLLGVLHIPIPPPTQGEDRSEWLSSGFKPPSSTVSLSTGSVLKPSLHTVRAKDHRLLWDENSNEFELFDLRVDPEAIHNVLTIEPEVTLNLQKLLVERLGELTQEGSLDGTTAKIPEHLLERLKALGYIQ